MHKLTDQEVKGITIGLLCLYIAVLITGWAMHQLLLFVAVMNTVAGVLIIAYWIWDKLRPLMRMTERRELIVLSLEGLFVVAATHAIISTGLNTWLVVIQYIIFALHAIALALFIIFMLTFKIKKLF